MWILTSYFDFEMHLLLAVKQWKTHSSKKKKKIFYIFHTLSSYEDFLQGFPNLTKHFTEEENDFSQKEEHSVCLLRKRETFGKTCFDL